MILTEYRITNIIRSWKFTNTEYRIPNNIRSWELTNTEYRILFGQGKFTNTEYRIVLFGLNYSNTELFEHWNGPAYSNFRKECVNLAQMIKVIVNNVSAFKIINIFSHFLSQNVTITRCFLEKNIRTIRSQLFTNTE